MNAKEILKQINLKKVVIGRGHDGMGLIADVYFGKQKIAEFLDDGWGGESDIRFVSDVVETNIKKFFSNAKLSDYMKQNGWDFMKEKEIDFHTQFGYAVEEAANQIEKDKGNKKRERDCIKGFVYGHENVYQLFSWKGFKTLEEIAKRPQGKLTLQLAYNKIKKELKKDEIIFNTPEQLTSLGLNL